LWIPQSLRIFPDAETRDASISTPISGTVSYLEDSKSYESYDGFSWVPQLGFGIWQDYEPTLTGGWGNGNGTYNYAKYMQIGKTVNVTVYFTLGSTTTKGAGLEITLPTLVNKPIAGRIFQGTGKCNPGGATTFLLAAETVASDDKAVLTVWGSAAAYVNQTAITATVPATWATGNYFNFNLTYEVE
jgi:hypothetical protein